MALTEQRIREVADKFGLTVLKRVTTGNERAGFATFELSGSRVFDAWRVIHNAASGDQLKGGFVYLRSSDADFTPYIGIESIYFDQ